MPGTVILGPDRGHPLFWGHGAWWLATPRLAAGPKWYDLCGLNHGTLTSMGNANNGWRYGYRPGGWGQMLFDGSAGHVLAPGSPSLSASTNLTIVAWINTAIVGAAPLGYQVVVARKTNPDATAPAPYWFGLIITTNNLMFYHYNTTDGGDLKDSGVAIAINTWHHVAVTTNGTAIVMYQNGKSIYTGTLAYAVRADSTTALGIGRYGDDSTYPELFQGSLDDVHIYNGRTLNAIEVQALYDESLRGYPGMLLRQWSRPVAAPGGLFSPANLSTGAGGPFYPNPLAG